MSNGTSGGLPTTGAIPPAPPLAASAPDPEAAFRRELLGSLRDIAEYLRELANYARLIAEHQINAS